MKKLKEFIIYGIKPKINKWNIKINLQIGKEQEQEKLLLPVLLLESCIYIFF